MKRSIRRIMIGCVFAAGLGLSFDAFAQPACPPGSHFQPGAGCVQNAPPPPPVVAPGQRIPPAELMIVGARRIKLRQCPTPQCVPLAVLSRGTPVRILGAQGEWVRVRVPQTGIEGWTLRRHLNF